MMGGLHPRGSLYERPVNIDTAKLQHARFREVLREHGVKVTRGRMVGREGIRLAAPTPTALAVPLHLRGLRLHGTGTPLPPPLPAPPKHTCSHTCSHTCPHTQLHTQLRTAAAAAAQVLTVREILAFAVEEHIGARVELEDLAMVRAAPRAPAPAVTHYCMGPATWAHDGS